MSRTSTATGFALCFLLLAVTPLRMYAQLDLDPRIDASALRVTVFASGLSYPLGMAELPDGSVLVGVTNQPRFLSSTSGSLVRLVDEDGDGVADVVEPLATDVPGGRLTAVRRVDDLVFVTGMRSPITIYQLETEVGFRLNEVGRITVTYDVAGRGRPHSALAVRSTPGDPSSYDLVFQVGASENARASTDTARVTSTIGTSGPLIGGAVHMVRVSRNGAELSGSEPILVARGLRNASGLAFDPSTGDLLLAENGIAGFPPHSTTELYSADELNVVPAEAIGVKVLDFGFPDNYTRYRTGEVVGGEGVQPLIAFQPIPDPLDGYESVGPFDLAFAPAGFPEGLNTGVFVGFHGRRVLAGLSNEENPVVYVDLEDGEYFHFVSSASASVGHPNGLLATESSLYVADMSPGGGFLDANAHSGVIYQISPANDDRHEEGEGQVEPEDSEPEPPANEMVRGGEPDESEPVTLVGNYPNPFNPVTSITYVVTSQTYVRLSVHDILGREIVVLVDRVVDEGTHEAEFNAGNLPSGVYVYQLNTPFGHYARTMALMK